MHVVRKTDLSTIQTPAVFAFNPTDQVVRAQKTQRVMARWGGQVTGYELIQSPDDDVLGHVIAGDMFSPGQTAPLVAAILRWFGPFNCGRPLCYLRFCLVKFALKNLKVSINAI